MTLWFTSDTHYGHANIIKYSNRPFANVEEMEAEMVNRWNSVVTPDDLVYHLGDFAFLPRAEIVRILNKLNGTKRLITGNHDKSEVRTSEGWDSVQPYLELDMGGTKVVLCHYPFAAWNKSHHGSINLHGHNHGTFPDTDQQIDVGVDCWDYRPVTFEKIMERAKTKPPWRKTKDVE